MFFLELFSFQAEEKMFKSIDSPHSAHLQHTLFPYSILSFTLYVHVSNGDFLIEIVHGVIRLRSRRNLRAGRSMTHVQYAKLHPRRKPI